MAAFIGHLPPFEESTQSFESWVELFEEYCSLNKVLPEEADGSTKKALFLTHVGARHYSYLHTACLPQKANTKKIKELCQMLKNKYDPPGLQSTNKFLFHKRVQKVQETETDFLTAVTQLASKCDFGAYEDQACTYQVITGVRNENIRKKLLSLNNPTFSQVKEVVLQEEAIQKQLDCMSRAAEAESVVGRVYKSQGRRPQAYSVSQKCSNCSQGQSRDKSHQNKSQESMISPSQRHHESQSKEKNMSQCQGASTSQQSNMSECYRCGRSHNPNMCPARYWKCYVCQRVGHTSVKCRRRPIHDLNCKNNENDNAIDCVVEQLVDGTNVLSCNDDNDDSYNVNILQVNKVEHKSKLIKLNVENVSLTMEVDTGAAISIISYPCYLKYFNNVTIKPSAIKLNGISGQIQIAGIIEVKVMDKVLSLVVCKNKNQCFMPLMGRDWLDQLFPMWRGAVLTSSNVKCNLVQNVSDQSLQVLELVKNLKNKFPKVFSTENRSCIQNFEASLCLKENSTPVFMRPYEVPYSIVDKISESIDKLEAEGKIYKVSHSEWASPLVPVKKSDGSYRLCVDFKRTVNPNLKIDIYPLPTAENIFASMSGGKIFVVLDLSDAYTQLKVSAHSQKLLTVNTHKGLYRFNRLIYGIASAPAIFQSVMDQVLSGVENTKCFIDDILIKGNNLQDCYNTVVKVLQKLSQYNIQVNFRKCKWFCESVEYLGHIISSQGRSPSPTLVEAVIRAKTPENVKELRSYLGLLNFYHNYLENISMLVKPLRELTENKTKWLWTNTHQQIFELSKQKLVDSKILMHYNPSLPIVVYSDGSPVGLGAILCHIVEENKKLVEKPVMFASCTLTEVQRKYSQLDREALAIVYAVTKFHKYLWGRRFTIVTDNAPIKHILHPNKSIPTLAAQRLQHWALILENYDYNIVHKKSEYLMHADAMSRLPMNKIVVDVNNCQLEQLPLSYVDIARETLCDSVLLKVFNFTKNGWPNHITDNAIMPYFKIRHYISIIDECLVFGSRLIVPQKFQALVLNLLHESHPGIVRTKMLARSLFWWPCMSQDIELKCKSCEICSIVNFKPDNVKIPWPKCDLPFQRVHIDFFEYEKRHFLIFCDSYSKWIDIKLMQQCTASYVIRELYSIFSVVGLPCEIVSDNGPPFDSYQFIEFCTKLNIKVTKTPPYHPESNGFAERNVQIAKKALKKIIVNNCSVDIQLELSKFLLNYRNTQTTVNCKTPNSMLMSYMPRTALTILNPVHNPKSMKRLPYYPHFTENETVLVKVGSASPCKGTIVKVLSSTLYLVNVNGVLKRLHLNQISNASYPQVSVNNPELIPNNSYFFPGGGIQNNQDTNASQSNSKVISQQSNHSNESQVPLTSPQVAQTFLSPQVLIDGSKSPTTQGTDRNSTSSVTIPCSMSAPNPTQPEVCRSRSGRIIKPPKIFNL